MKRITALFLPVLLICVANGYTLPPAAAGYGLAWSDEFNDTTLDTVNTWSYDTGQGMSAAQMEFDTRGCVTVENGSLVIWSRHFDTGHTYPSGRIDTHDKKIFTYGYFEAAIQGPIGTGKNGPGSVVRCLASGQQHPSRRCMAHVRRDGTLRAKNVLLCRDTRTRPNRYRP